MREWRRERAGCGGMANLATDVRPAIVGALLLTIALVPWVEPQCARKSPHAGAAFIAMEAPVRVLGHRDGGLIRPGDHPDARPWPHGMVIAPPSVDPWIQQLPSPLDSVLSALLAPFWSITS